MKLFPDKFVKKSPSFRAFAQILKELFRFKVAVDRISPFGLDSIQILDNFGYMVGTSSNRLKMPKTEQ